MWTYGNEHCPFSSAKFVQMSERSEYKLASGRLLELAPKSPKQIPPFVPARLSKLEVTS